MSERAFRVASLGGAMFLRPAFGSKSFANVAACSLIALVWAGCSSDENSPDDPQGGAGGNGASGGYAGKGAQAGSAGKQSTGGSSNGGNGSASGGSGGSSNPASGGSSGSGSSAGGAGGKTSSGGAGGIGNAGTGGTAGSTNGGSTGNDVCSRWNADRADMAEGTWSGSVASCNAGDISANGRSNALRLLNLYRFMAGLSPVTTDPTRNQKAQACALMMDANNELSHDPPESWDCWSKEGAEAAGSSNISSGKGVSSVDLYMIDPGNQTTLGHRRWILSNGLDKVGLGSTTGASCMWVFGGKGKDNRKWTAWPPPGKFPAEAVKIGSSIDQTGWSLQSETIDLGPAKVSVLANGADAPVTVTHLAQNYGAKYALRFNPKGWTTKSGTSYKVSVTGISTAIEYTVDVVSCK
jgi:uncharacterized protein YkwD